MTEANEADASIYQAVLVCLFVAWGSAKGYGRITGVWPKNYESYEGIVRIGTDEKVKKVADWTIGETAIASFTPDEENVA